jgi:exodeoxyribonuclease V alpha subunit
MDYIEGTISNITFYSEDNGFAIMKIEVTERSTKQSLFTLEKTEKETVKGTIPSPIKGETYRFYGSYEHHQKYGQQFTFKNFEKIEEANEEGLMDYLSSNRFKGVGERTARRILNTLGKDAINKIMKDPSTLNKVPKLSSKIKDTIEKGLRENKEDEQTLIKLYSYDITPRIAMRIIKVYGEKTIKVLEKNPYRMIDEVDGIGFERADDIARTLGFSHDHPARIKAMIITLFTKIAMQRGHTYLDKGRFMNLCKDKLSKGDIDIDETLVDKGLETLIEEKRFITEDGALTLRSLAKAEEVIAERAHTLTQNLNDIDTQKVHSLIKDFETKENITYSFEQRQTILEALRHQSMILTGGPGTGKTTVIKGIVYVFYNYHKIERPSFSSESSIHMIAPTGRAAKRMQESTGYYATTIHRFLGYAFDGTFAYGRSLPRQGDIFIIDESSMIDTYLASKLLESLEDDARVIFVGDEAQLPSVGPGQVFKDLIDSKLLMTVTLKTIYRQSKDSHIIELANHIREGTLPSDAGTPYEDRYLIKESEANFKTRLKSIIDYLINQGYTLFETIQVLIPMYKGEVGIHSVNEFLQATYNDHTEKTMTHQGKTFRMFDKILQLTNQVEDGVMNGDQGQVTGIDETKGLLYATFMDKEVTYKKRDLSNITHAYAMSIHKSQGSEYGVVILPLFRSYSIMLKRKLIYTAITRAEEKLIIIGDIPLLNKAITTLEDDRHTRLKEKLIARLSGREATIDSIIKSMKEPIKEETHEKKIISDPAIPFDTFGEDIGDLSPYDFMSDKKR